MEQFVMLQSPEDLFRVRAIADDIWPKTFREILSPEQIVYMMKMMYSPEVMARELAEGYSFELFVIDGKDAGYMVYAPYEEPGMMKLHKLYLLEEYQGKGFGQKMLRHVAERAEERGFTSVILAVTSRISKLRRRMNALGLSIINPFRLISGTVLLWMITG